MHAVAASGNKASFRCQRCGVKEASGRKKIGYQSSLQFECVQKPERSSECPIGVEHASFGNNRQSFTARFKGGAGQQRIRRSLSLNLWECAHGLPILPMDCLLLESISREGRFGKDRNGHRRGVERSMASRIGKLATAARFSALLRGYLPVFASKRTRKRSGVGKDQLSMDAA